MPRSVLFFSFVIYVTLTCCLAVPTLKILLGELPTIGRAGPTVRLAYSRPAMRGQFPHQAYVIADDVCLCGGSLISASWVLTSGLCTHAKSKFQVSLGVVDVSASDTNSRTFVSRHAITHETFNRFTYADDIGLIHIPFRVSFSEFLKPVRLPSNSDAHNTYQNYNVDVSGWGKVCGGNEAVKELRYITTKVISNQQCLRNWPNYSIPPSKICTMDNDNTGLMPYDSGDPVVVSEHDGFKQIGIASFASKSMCQDSTPSAHTRLTAYLGWIQHKTGIVGHS